MGISTHSKSRIVKNSTVLYLRMLFTMFLNLYAIRLILANLGVEDYGTYGVVGSIVAFFSVFTTGVTSAINRFISFELGKQGGDVGRIFCTSLNTIFILAFALFVIMEVSGSIVIKQMANIPVNKLTVAMWVFQFSVITSMVSLISVPYNALIIAYEKLDAFAIISMLQVILNFLAAYLLTLWDQSNRLLVYALLIAGVSILIRLIYQIYCRILFQESKYRLLLDIETLKEIGKYTGTTTVSGTIKIASSQGLVFLINLLYGVGINAVYSVGRQIEYAIMSFGLNFYRAMSPQIIKTYANHEYDIHKKLVYTGSKLDAYMIMFVLIPFCAKTEYILGLWLKEVPQYTVEYVRWSVVISFLYCVVNPIIDAVRASNRIAAFMIIPELLLCLAIPLGYVVYQFDSHPVNTIIVIVITHVIVFGVRLIIASRVTILSLKELICNVMIPCCFVSTISMVVCMVLAQYINDTIAGLIGLVVINSLLLFIIIYFCGFNRYERMIMESMIKQSMSKLKNNVR